MNFIKRLIKNWYPTANVDAQAAHVGWGMAFMLAFHLYGFSLLGSFAFVTLWIGIKEWVFDILEEKDTLTGSAVDSAFYVIGALLGMAVILTS